MSTKKKMDIEEFVEFGYLQEANRRFFHPLGLQLEVCEFAGTVSGLDEEQEDKTRLILDGLWDRRSSKHSKILLSKVDPDKALRVASEMKARRPARVALPECNSGGFQKVPRG